MREHGSPFCVLFHYLGLWSALMADHIPSTALRYRDARTGETVAERPVYGHECYIPTCSCGWRGIPHAGYEAHERAGIRAEMHAERMLPQ